MTAIHADAALRHRPHRALALGLAIMLALAASIGLTAATRPSPVAAAVGTYENPLLPQIPGDGVVESCADPSVIRGQQPGDRYWYMYCTTDPLNDEDRNASGGFNFHLMPMLRSLDLVNWTYMGDAFTTRPAWIRSDAGLWAPEIDFFNGQYYLYYTVTETNAPLRGSAIGVATSSSPLGPWTDKGSPVVEPHAPPRCCPNDRRHVFDPEVIQAHDGNKYIYYGSYFGGVSVRRLSADGLTSDPGTQVQVAAANRYEGPEIVTRTVGGTLYYYMMVSATDCCRGPVTGYSVFVGRSTSPTGPFLDRSGVDLDPEPNAAGQTGDGRVGGTVVLSMNGNRWVGPGHNTVFTDFAGQDWTIYHAIDRFDPYFAGAPGFDKRPAMLDPLDWIGGWPTVNGGRWASDQPRQAPAAQPGEQSNYRMRAVQADELGQLMPRYSDEFNDTTLSGQWTWVRPQGAAYGEQGGNFRFETEGRELYQEFNTASILTQPAPNGNYVVEARVHLNVPPGGCCYNYTQTGLVIYGNDDNFVKLTHSSIWETRQTEWAKEWISPIPTGTDPRYGNSVVGPPGDWTYLRIVRRAVGTRSGGGSEEAYTAYTSRDGMVWERGGTWTHELGTGARIGLIAMGEADPCDRCGDPGNWVALFDYVRVYQLHR